MKANELMIGDWVMSTVGTPTPVKVYALGNNFIDLRYGDVEQSGVLCLCEFDPIPLTEEILKLNGFARNPKMKRWIIDGELELIEDTMGNMEIEYWFSVSDQYICPIHHVHELQHALRLCGLNELAENLKVEL